MTTRRLRALRLRGLVAASWIALGLLACVTPATPNGDALAKLDELVELDALAELDELAGGVDPGEAQLVSDGRYAMGTVLEFSLSTSDARAARSWIDDGYREVAELERLFSRRDPASEVARLNAKAGDGMQPIPWQLSELLALARDYAALTHGSFDVTVAPLVELWMEAARRQREPSSAELSRVLARVGGATLRLDGVGRAELAVPGAAIDLSGIAKGYTLDRLAQGLRQRGFEQALLSFGQSSIRALGAPPDEPGWRLLLRRPGDGFAGFITLNDRAFSVSSSHGQWAVIGGKHYGHVIDPRSGEPVARGVQAAVIAPTAALAEALSTALVVLGESEGIALIESLPAAEAMFVDEAGVVASTRGWQRASQFEAIEAIETSIAVEPPR